MDDAENDKSEDDDEGSDDEDDMDDGNCDSNQLSIKSPVHIPQGSFI